MKYTSAFAGKNGLWLLTSIIDMEKRDTEIWTKFADKGFQKGKNYFPTLYDVEIKEKTNFITIKGTIVSAKKPNTFELTDSNISTFVIKDFDLSTVDEGLIGKKEIKYLKKQMYLCKETFDSPSYFEATVPNNQVIRLEQGDLNALLHFLGVITFF